MNDLRGIGGYVTGASKTVGRMSDVVAGMAVVSETITSGGSTGATGSENGDSDFERISKDQAFFLLKNRRRRAVIEYLLEQDGSAQFDDLVVAIAAQENEKSVDEITYKERKSVHTSLYQSHLPKLEESGVIEYGRRSGSVVLTDAVATIRPYLEVNEVDETEAADREDRSWLVAYVGLLAVTALATTLHGLGGTAGTLLLATLLLGIVFGIGAVLWRRNRR
jgi:hypothetical protein